MGLIERFGLGSNLGFDSGLATARASPACTVSVIGLLELRRRQSPRHRRRALSLSPGSLVFSLSLVHSSRTPPAGRHRRHYHLPSRSPLATIAGPSLSLARADLER